MHPALKTYFQKYPADGLLITNLNNVRYLSDFTGTNGLLLITSTRGYFFTDFRYREQATNQVTDFEIVEMGRDLFGDVLERLKDCKIKRLGFEAPTVNYAQYLRLQKSLRGIKLVPVTEDPGKLREVKTEIEIKKIAKALAINKLAFEEMREMIKGGVTEIEIKTEIEMAMLKHGADKIGFDTIVASGWRGALPHGVASNKKIKVGELVTIDFGCTADGYNSDETVTVLVGETSLPVLSSAEARRNRRHLSFAKERTGRGLARQLEIHQIVFEAQRAAIAVAHPGVKCSDIDKAARDYITKKGYGQYFGHALGHGVGLEVHERPVLSPNSTDVLEEGMVFTIEPGIYIPGFGGVRIEDVFMCTKSGVRRLSKIEKKL
ncbi:MAG: aminopeptidase P family protein [Candidatus Magasanikbacteria bacterium]|nr:aminopeptidase P family protein [Candidatus Magasanikbacteria bacterium]